MREKSMVAMGDGIRDIERIEENDDEPRMPRLVTAALVVFGGACVLFAGAALGGRTSGPPEKKSDPLGELLARGPHAPATSSAASAAAATDLSPKDVTFPRLLSDDAHPPTALAAVRGAPRGGGASLAAPASAPVVDEPPPPTDRLSVVPLPAQAVLEATPVVTRPRDALTQAATEAASLDAPPRSSDTAAPGHEGGYQLQVSSFRTRSEAQGFAEQLRARGHKAYVAEADVPGRGVWYRVRIGPFPTLRAAADYRAAFEQREHVVPFVVTPEAPRPR